MLNFVPTLAFLIALQWKRENLFGKKHQKFTKNEHYPDLWTEIIWIDLHKICKIPQYILY